MSASPSRRHGLIALGHCRAGCAGLRPSCARSASISPSRRKKAGRGRGPSPSPATFSAPEKPGEFASAPSAPSTNSGKANAGNGFSAQCARTQTSDADANPRRADGSGQGDDQTVRANPLENNAVDTADGADANPPPQSGSEKQRNPAGVQGYERSRRMRHNFQHRRERNGSRSGRSRRRELQLGCLASFVSNCA